MACRIYRDKNGRVEKVLAPNGKESKLYQDLIKSIPDEYTPDEYVQEALDKGMIRNLSKEEVALALWNKTHEAPFKQWFGDSKVVDENGEPLLVYHGTQNQFDIFDPAEVTIEEGWSKTFSGFHFSTSKSTASEFGEILIHSFLSSKNTKEVSDTNYEMLSGEHWDSEIIRAKKEKFDGLKYINKHEGSLDTSFVVFSPNQIKSPFNIGLFSEQNDNIYYQTENKGVQNKEIADRLIPILDRLGVKVESLEHWAEVTGQTVEEGIVALADIGRKMIAINKDKADQSTLPEEVMHLVLEQFKDDYEFGRVMKYVEKTNEYQTHAEEYREKYDGDEVKVKMEIAGKIGGKAVIKNIEREGDSALIRMLKRLWEKFRNLFRDQNVVELENYLNSIAEGVLQDQVEEITGEGVYYQSEKAKRIYEAIKRRRKEKTINEIIKTEEEILKKIIGSLKQRKKSLENRARAKEANKLQRQIDALQEQIDTNYNGLGLFKFLKYMKEDSEKALKYIDNVARGGRELTPKSLQELGEYISYYEPYLQELEEFALYRTNDLKSTTKRVLEKLIPLELEKFRKIREFRDVAREEEYISWFRERVADELNLDINDPNIDQIIQERMGGYDFKQQAKEVHSDSNFLRFWAGNLRDAGDQLLRVVYAVVDRAKRVVHNNVFSFGKDVVAKAESLGFKGKSVDFVYETNVKGDLTGYFIDEMRYRDFEEARKKFAKELHEKYNLSDEWDKRRLQKQEMEEGQLDAYNKEWARWFEKNTRPIDNVNEVINKRKEELGGGTSPAFQEWKRLNIGHTKSGYTYYKGELSVPSDGRMVAGFKGKAVQTVDWTNKKYAALTKQQKELLSYLKELKAEIDAALPNNIPPNLAPQVSRSMMDIVFRSRGDMFRNMGVEIAEQLGVGEKVEGQDEAIFGLDKHERPDGSFAKYLPIYYRKKLSDPNKLTTDALSAIIAYKEMAENYREMAKILPELEMVQEQIGARKYVSRKGVQSGTRTQTFKVIDKFIEMHVYGMRKEALEVDIPEGIPLIGGKKFNFSKFFTKLNNYVRANNLAYNFFTTMSNYIQSGVFSKIEDLVGEYTNQKGKNFAEQEFLKNIHVALSEMNQVNKTSKMHLAMEKMGIAGENLFSNLDKSRLTKRAIDSGLYWSYELVDYRIKSKVMLAVFHNYRQYEGRFYTKEQFDKLGVSVDYYSLPSAYDMMQVKNYKLETTIPEKELLKLQGRVEYIANQIDGRLSPLDFAAAHQHAVIQLVTTHRGWLFSGIQRRFRGKGINFMTGQLEEGYFRTTGRLMYETFLSKERVRSMKELWNRWEELDTFERKGLMRMTYEVVFATAVLVVAKTINSLADDDDDYTLDVAAYMSNRALLEVSSFLNPTEFFYTLDAPIVATRQLELAFDIADMFSSEVVERGQYKGFTKRERLGLKLLPGVKGMMLWRDPVAPNNFLKAKPLKLVY